MYEFNKTTYDIFLPITEKALKTSFALELFK